MAGLTAPLLGGAPSVRPTACAGAWLPHSVHHTHSHLRLFRDVRMMHGVVDSAAAAEESTTVESWYDAGLRLKPADESPRSDSYSFDYDASLSLTPTTTAVAAVRPGVDAGPADGDEGILLVALTGVVAAFQLVGPLCLLLVFVALGCALDVDTSREAAVTLGFSSETASAQQLLASLWVTSEAAFYLVQQIVALQPALGYSPFTGVAMWAPERRREFWRRLLATQPPDKFLTSWLYKDESHIFPTPAELVLGRAGVPGAISPHAASAASEASFRGVSWEEITLGDAYEWGARALFATSSRSALTPSQDAELQSLISELEDVAGMQLAPGEPTPSVKSMCSQMDRVNWRSRPLLYYALLDGLVQAALARPKMESLGYQRRQTEELSYYYRRGRRASALAAPLPTDAAVPAGDAFIYVHGIGIGPSNQAEIVERMVDDGTTVIAVEIDAISQKLFPQAALSPDRFSELLDRTLADLEIDRAVICGHSYGTAMVSYALNRDRERPRPRLCGTVLLDPICTLLHHATTTREFVYRPASGLMDAVADYLFKKELWTSLAVSRSLVFHEASFFLEECSAHRPTLIAVSMDDVIVDPVAIAKRFGSPQSRRAGVRVLSMDGIGHGGWISDSPAQGDRLVEAVRGLRREVADIGRLEKLPCPTAMRGVVVPTGWQARLQPQRQ